MQKSLLASLLLIVGFSVTVNAGGTKNIATAVTAVVSIETIDPSPWYLGAGFVWAKLSEVSATVYRGVAMKIQPMGLWCVGDMISISILV